MKKYIIFGCIGLLFVFLILVGCVVEDKMNSNEVSKEKVGVNSVNTNVAEPKNGQNVNADQHQNLQNQFDQVKQEIDYWYDQGPNHIGKNHHDKLLKRLGAFEGTFLQQDVNTYKQKLEMIVLAQEGATNGAVVKDKTGNQNENMKNDLQNEKNGKPMGSCEGSGAVVFTHAPMAVSEIETIQPMGLMIGGHVTPIDHGYYNAKKWKNAKERKVEDFVDVFAPAAGLVEVQSMPGVYASSTIGDYRLILRHTCTFYTIYIHVNQISEKLQKVVDGKRFVKVEAGEVIGKAPAFDFSVVNDEVTLSGFVVPSSYDAEEWKIHTVDMFDSFQEPLRTELLAKDLRQAMPRGGKIDYDIEGKLVGNWFEEGTNGYFGKKEFNRMPGYWQTHAAFAYDALDPRLVIVSLGDFKEEAQQFAVAGNSPNPATVGVDSGVVKYELVKYDYKTVSEENWDRWHFAKIGKAYGIEGQVEGVVVVQMLSDRKMKMEVFAGGTASTVKGFSGKEKVYVR